MSLHQLHTILQAIILSRLTYAIPVWGPYLNVELNQRIDAFLKISSLRFLRVNFRDIQVQPCTISLLKYRPLITVFFTFSHLPPRRQLHQILRAIDNGFDLPSYDNKLDEQSFVTNCLFKYSKQYSHNQYPLFSYFDFIKLTVSLCSNRCIVLSFCVLCL